jgi:hypothetical protein
LSSELDQFKAEVAERRQKSRSEKEFYDEEVKKWEAATGKLVVAMNRIDGHAYSSKHLLLGEEFSARWKNKRCRQRLEALRERMPSDSRDHVRLREHWQEALTLNEIRNRAAHGTFMVLLGHNMKILELSLTTRDELPNLSLIEIEHAADRCVELGTEIFSCMRSISLSAGDVADLSWLSPPVP